MDYLKRIFTDKKVLCALAIIILAFIALVVSSVYIKNKAVMLLIEISSFILMFLQFPTISNKAMEEYAEMDEKKKSKVPLKHKKKK